MGDWLVARVAPHLYARAQRLILRPTFYPLVRTRDGPKALYPGYMFVQSPIEWYSIVAASRAVYGIVAAASTLEPMRSDALDRHVEVLMGKVERDGCLPDPNPRLRTRFLRGDRVRVESAVFAGEGLILRPRGTSFEVEIGAVKMIAENWMLHELP